MVTLREIALRTGYSIATVSRALSDHPYVREETRARVEAVARELDYRPNALARGLRRSQTRTVGLLVPDILNSSHSSVAAALLQSQLQDFGYGLVLQISKNDSETERHCLDRLRLQQIDGLVHVPFTTAGARVLTEGPRAIPVIELFRRSSADDLDAVVYDDEVVGLKVVTHLLGLGHRHIGVIAGPRRLGSTKRRLRGVHRAVAEAGLTPDVLRIVHGEYTTETGRRAFRQLTDDVGLTTAIFATSTQFLLGAALASRAAKVSIPGQVSLAGFGDPEWAQLTDPPLTTYALPLREMIMTTAQLLLTRMDENERAERSNAAHIVVSGSLMVRSSTAPPASGPFT